MQSETLVRKIKSLPPEAVAEVENFVEFMMSKVRRKQSQSRYEAIAKYAAENAGSEVDLDIELR